MLIGTPDYLAPEQARSARTADIRADIYSLGCVFYHALTGQSPFPDTSVLNQVMRHATESPRPLSDFLSPTPDGLQNVLNWMMAKDPSQRYATPDRAAQAVKLFLQHTPANKPAKAPVPAYVKWLESSPDADPGRAPVVPANIPLGKLETPGRKTEPAKPAEPRKPAAPPPQAAPTPRIDVELIPIPPPSASRQDGEEPRGLLELNRRDAIMLIAGGLLVAIAILAGWGLSKLFRREPPPENPPAAPSPNPPAEG
jgi:serine/threonine protein kinase